MGMYYVGEFGYEAEGEFRLRADAEEAAIDKSIEEGTTAISIWDENEEIVSVAINGEIFDKR